MDHERGHIYWPHAPSNFQRGATQKLLQVEATSKRDRRGLASHHCEIKSVTRDVP